MHKIAPILLGRVKRLIGGADEAGAAVAIPGKRGQADTDGDTDRVPLEGGNQRFGDVAANSFGHDAVGISQQARAAGEASAITRRTNYIAI